MGLMAVRLRKPGPEYFMNALRREGDITHVMFMIVHLVLAYQESGQATGPPNSESSETQVRMP
jgi:hypothetical protein